MIEQMTNNKNGNRKLVTSFSIIHTISDNIIVALF